MLTLRVQAIAPEAEGIRSFVLVDPNGARLPSFEPGAHIDVQIPGGFTRQYSLYDPPEEGDRYKIAVLKVPNGRGGSAAMHRHVQPGDLLRVSAPRNTFPLIPDARHSILIAGGIGITPILSMAQALERQQASYQLRYYTRSAALTAFAERVGALAALGRASLHHDGGDVTRFDLGAGLETWQEGTHLYFCGPGGFMRTIRRATEHWPRNAVHWEDFSASDNKASEGGEAKTFNIRLNRSRRIIRASADKSILTAIRDSGIQWETSCEAGVCGTCRARYLSGYPEHNDHVLTEEERREFVLICCARVSDDSLVLDI
jgi:ferredoxin-NADP reductase